MVIVLQCVSTARDIGKNGQRIDGVVASALQKVDGSCCNVIVHVLLLKIVRAAAQVFSEAVRIMLMTVVVASAGFGTVSHRASHASSSWVLQLY
jgi:hypothetical protein